MVVINLYVHLSVTVTVLGTINSSSSRIIVYLKIEIIKLLKFTLQVGSQEYLNDVSNKLLLYNYCIRL